MSGLSSPLQGLLDQFKDSCSSFDVNSPSKRFNLSGHLDAIAVELAHSEEARKQIGSNDTCLWTNISKLWRSLARAQLTFWDGDSSSEDGDTEDKQDGSTSAQGCTFSLFCVSLSRFTRNLVAAVPPNQIKAFESEPEMRRLLHYYTSWTSMEDQDAVLAARILTQTLSNIITGNNALMSVLWETYLNLPEDQVVLMRLLLSRDDRTLVAVMTLVKNCIVESRTRAKMLTRTTIGTRLCVSLLDNMVKLYEADEGSDAGKAFDTGYEIFTRIFEAGLLPELYSRLSIEGEIVTPHQTTLLKILDSYLQSTPVLTSLPNPKLKKMNAKLAPMLSNCFFGLSSYAQSAIRRALRPSEAELVSPTVSPISLPTPHSHNIFLPAELDVMLPKVCEAIVLVTQCIVSIILASQDAQSPDSELRLSQSVQDYFNNQNNSDGVGLVENLIVLLRLLDRFLPRINFGKPVETPRNTSFTTHTNQGDIDSSRSQPSQQQPGPSLGFSYLKRDLVRLLGILCHERLAVQDRVRSCGGIEVVLNLCVVDERNPYLREHAIFALHNLLKGNAANQAVVDEIKPLGHWDENGVLTDAPGATRR